MKKVLFSLLLAVIVSFSASAQATYEKGDVLLNLGIGLGYYYAGGVPLIGSAEFAINDAVSIGPYVSYTSYRYGYFSSSYRYSFIDFGARGSYHFSKHLSINTDKLDLYGGASLGYVASSYSGPDSQFYDDPYGGNIRAGIFGGARWYLSDKFSLNGEVGYGLSPLVMGVSFKL